MKTAIVVGATGLIGKRLTKKLLDDDRYSKVKIFVRRSVNISRPKLEEHLVDFENLDAWKNQLTGDELFSSLGTTIRKAGSKEAQYKIDFTYQHNTAKAAKENGVSTFVLVSSAGANSSSSNFYLRIKGELEEAVEKLNFNRALIFQPSLLVGNREEERIGEKAGYYFLTIFTKIFFPLKKYRPILGEEVAQAMINSTNRNSTERISKFALDKIFNLLHE